MAAKAEEHRNAVGSADPTVGIPGEHQTGADGYSKKRKEEEEEETGSRESTKRRRCQLALDKESARGSGSFSFDTRCVLPIETTPKFGSFNSSADLVVELVLGEEKREKRSGAAAAEEEERSGLHREVGGSGEAKYGI